MTYSFTEKKRIRRQFGTLPNVMSLPYLIKTQTDSYAEFLQENLDPHKRENNGLEEVFKSIFPIDSAESIVKNNSIIINTTPIGMKINKSPFAI